MAAFADVCNWELGIFVNSIDFATLVSVTDSGYYSYTDDPPVRFKFMGDDARFLSLDVVYFATIRKISIPYEREFVQQDASILRKVDHALGKANLS